MKPTYSSDPTKASKKMVLAIQDRNDLKYVKIKDELKKLKERMHQAESTIRNLIQQIYE